MIKTIIFDLGNVIVNFDEANIFKTWSASSGKTVTEIIRYIKNSSTRKAFERGEINPNQFYYRTTEELGMKINLNNFKKAWNEIFTLNKDVENLIRNLKGRFRLILLSNTNVWQYGYVKKNYRIVDIFDEHILSYEVGCRKPNPRIFLTALMKAKTFPCNCAYFDDIPEFIYTARFLGIKAFQFRNVEKLKDDLRKLKIV